ncbi:hypothetical protein HYPDE_30703 [Hyphomicrobium denitrificans 1NES1]|uniref:Lysozyme inhibitor LprI-like N-terminal domain-containing protein n=1 Tax=Hyphomicrobium denitrificans 1NES1 TaxID=670307 RepID=N0BCG5_9HYPH|nr:lysozyme inhibitor LprI family protein [Hyphomicrobium denitrificans]AGK57815.1 hypothetical protein HYPDE_30703 [Hyphomicrobium denitrificans 1NES1]
MKRYLAIIVLLLSLGSGSAHAENIDCANASSTVEINFCAEKDFQAADKTLNAAYEAALASINGRDLEKPYDAKSFEAALRASQRAWLAYRDADCKDLVAQEWSAGSGTTSASLGCMTEKTMQRTKELKERYGEH